MRCEHYAVVGPRSRLRAVRCRRDARVRVTVPRTGCTAAVCIDCARSIAVASPPCTVIVTALDHDAPARRAAR